MKCAYCGAEFEPHRSDQKYCSADCKHAAEAERHRLKYVKKEPRAQKCAICGAVFYTLKRNKRYCGDKCQREARREQAREFWHSKPKETKEKHKKETPRVSQIEAKAAAARAAGMSYGRYVAMMSIKEGKL